MQKHLVVLMIFDVTFDNFISGLVADMDIESEKYRRMGSARIDFYVSIGAPGFEAYGETVSYPESSTCKPIISYLIDREPMKLKRLGYQGPEIDLENELEGFK